MVTATLFEVLSWKEKEKTKRERKREKENEKKRRKVPAIERVQELASAQGLEQERERELEQEWEQDLEQEREREHHQALRIPPHLRRQSACSRSDEPTLSPRRPQCPSIRQFEKSKIA